MSPQRIECTRCARRVSLGGGDPREVLPCWSEVPPQAGRSFERGDRFGAAVAQERATMKQLVAQLKPSKEKRGVAIGDFAQRVESSVGGQLGGAPQAGVARPQRITI